MTGRRHEEGEMTETVRPHTILRYLLGTDAPRVQDVDAFPDARISDRKFRLFACACYHSIRHLLASPLADEAVEVAERFADGLASAAELGHARARLRESLDALEGQWRASRGAERVALQPIHDALALAYQVTDPLAPKGAYYASSNAYLDVGYLANLDAAPSDPAVGKTQAAEELIQCRFLCCIAGPLLFRDICVASPVLAWNDRCVVRVADTIYRERDFTQERMGVLADALEDAGCDDREIIGHCRNQQAVHVRGCWVVDFLTGRE
jgi:hypothetical protein